MFIAIEKGIIKSKAIIVDATHTGSRSNPYSQVEILKLRSKQLCKSLYDIDESIKNNLPAKNEADNLAHELGYTQMLLDAVSADETLINVPKIKERLNMLRETLSDIEDHYVTSKDEEARVGHKSQDSSFFGYKTHIAMSDERIITAATVTSGEKGDGPQLAELKILKVFQCPLKNAALIFIHYLRQTMKALLLCCLISECQLDSLARLVN